MTALEALPPEAASMFGDRLALAERYAALLASDGVTRGLIGPREPGRLWTRHLLNSAVAAEALPAGPLQVVDLGSGAGLPGVPIALVRPELSMALLEPMERRIAFLEEVRTALTLPLRIIRSRAEDVREPEWDIVVARAVAPLERLLALAAGLVHPGGMLVALKGRTAQQEVREATNAIRRYATAPAEVITVGGGAAAATVIRVRIDRPRGRG